MDELRALYPEIEPFQTGRLKVSDIHELYYEQCGQKDGNPVLFLHGGPGESISARHRRFFDPEVYRIVLFDQRGAGKSTPPGELKDNTTWALVEDIETLRKHLNIDQWVVFGGSWGCALSLAYAETHPDRVKALVLRGIYTFRRKEIQFMYQTGAKFVFPEEYERFLKPIPEVEQGDLISAYYRRLTGEDEEESLRCGQAWCRWETAISDLYTPQEVLDREEDPKGLLQYALIESHYLVNGAFLKTETQLLDDVEKIRHIPCTIVQGRYDMCCPVRTAWDLHLRFPEAEFHIVPDGGHSEYPPKMASLLVQACDKYKSL
ncbi:proline iminopeptidase [Lingula anatina]|uniref:Proline iminopeptidase n=1 Tax=Lingula anatina TaxID=7574 RepID=A0A1S3JFG8_LINAN|nr:proline iminopeptidase [Lingula anatina]|eukprot:XP_013409160.1 proline iminopeptidase [Lingula anatina]